MTAAPTPETSGPGLGAPTPDVPIEGKTVKTLILNHLKRTRAMFANGVVNEKEEEIELRKSYVPQQLVLIASTVPVVMVCSSAASLESQGRKNPSVCAGTK
jgi:hypothetical protein